MQLDISVFYRVRLFPSSVLSHDRYVSSIINISQALANRTGASALIILTSSSDFIIFFTLARGSWEFLKISGSKIFIRVKKSNPQAYLGCPSSFHLIFPSICCDFTIDRNYCYLGSNNQFAGFVNHSKYFYFYFTDFINIS